MAEIVRDEDIPMDFPFNPATDEEVVEEIRAHFKVSIMGTVEGMKETILILDHNMKSWHALPEVGFVEAVRQSSRGFPVSVLVMKHHRLQYLPKDLQVACSHVNHMDLSFNRLSSFSLHAPSAFASLKELNLVGNGLHTIGEEIGGLRQLQLLDLSRNELTSLPPVLGQLQNLTVLRAPFNKISTLSDEVCLLKNLLELEIHNNLLTTVHVPVGGWTQLKILHASCNFLSNRALAAILSSVGDDLRELYVANNCISVLPYQLGKRYKLQRLVIGGNPLEHPPPRVCRQGLVAIQQHLTKRWNKTLAATVQVDFSVVRNPDYYDTDTSDDDSDDYYVKLD